MNNERIKKDRINLTSNPNRGFTTIENYVIKIPYMSPACRSLLYCFYMYQNCPDIFISYSTIMEYTGITSKSSISKWLKFMQWIGFLKVEKRIDSKNVKYNSYSLNHYRIKDISDFIKEVEIDFRSIESYWNKIGKDNKKMDEFIEDKQSFTNALKEIMCRS